MPYAQPPQGGDPVTTFQPGDVAQAAQRLTAFCDEFERANNIRGRSRLDDDFYGINDIQCRVSDIRAVLSLATDPATLSPQAVLDAILEWACPANDPDEDGWHIYYIESHCAQHALTARKVDGHWQVKSVGGVE